MPYFQAPFFGFPCAPCGGACALYRFTRFTQTLNASSEHLEARLTRYTHSSHTWPLLTTLSVRLSFGQVPKNIDSDTTTDATTDTGCRAELVTCCETGTVPPLNCDVALDVIETLPELCVQYLDAFNEASFCD